MPKTRPAYPAEFRRQMVDLVRAGRDPTDLAREFEPACQTIQNWVAEADRSEGRREAKPPPADPGDRPPRGGPRVELVCGGPLHDG